MELGYKKLDDKEQKLAKSSFTFHARIRKFEFGFLVALFSVCVILAIVFGIWSIVDREKLDSFYGFGMMSLTLIGAFVVGYFLWKFIGWMLKRLSDGENLPALSNRTLRRTLSYMHGNIGGLIWEILWGTIVFSALIVCWGEGTFTKENMSEIVQTGLEMGVIFLVGDVFFKVIHNHSDYTKKMLKNTKEYYNYGNGAEDGKRYAEYVDWSIRENMQLCCKQFVLTKEMLLGYAHTDRWFDPVAIPRDFIKEAEYREVLWSNNKVSACAGVLACKLNNGKVIDFYLSRGPGNVKAVTLLRKYGMEFAIRNDMVEYQ